MDETSSSGLLQVTISSDGLEGVLRRLNDRVDEIDVRTKAQQRSGMKVTNVDASHGAQLAHLCETSGIQDLSTRSHGEQLGALVAVVNKMGQNVNQFYKEVKHSASEGIDLKIRKISSVFGTSFSSTEQPTPSFEDMRMTLAELRNSSDAFRAEMDLQEAATTQLTSKVKELQGALEDKLESLGETVQGDRAQGMKVVAELEMGLGTLEKKLEASEKKESETSERLRDCASKLEEMGQQIKNNESAAIAVAGVQDSLMEQAKAQEMSLQQAQNELQAKVDGNLDENMKSVFQEISLLNERMEIAAREATDSAETFDTFESTVRTTEKKLEDALETSAEAVSTLGLKLAEQFMEANRQEEALTSKVRNLSVTVEANKGILDGHITSYEMFVREAMDEQAKLTATEELIRQEVEQYRGENTDKLRSLERSNISMVTTVRALKRAVDALATKEGRWDRLEVQSRRHAQVLGGYLAELEEEVSFMDPFSLSPSVQKYLSAVSQMVAKIFATRADYEVTRQLVSRKSPAEDSDWDQKVEILRQRYLEKFVSDVTEVADKIRPSQQRTLREAREVFVKKLYLSMKLALSKYRPIQAGATILGKVQLLPACMACDRPFTDKPGPGNLSSVVHDSRGEHREQRGRSGRSQSASPARENRSPRGGAFPLKGLRANPGGTVQGEVIVAAPVPAPPSSVGEDDGGSVASFASLASRDSQISTSTGSRYKSGRAMEKSPQKYVLRGGFKMRQSSSEGTIGSIGSIGSIGLSTRGSNSGPDPSCRPPFGSGKSAPPHSVNAASIACVGRADILDMTSVKGFDPMEAEEEGEGDEKRRSRRCGADGRPLDKIDGSPLDLRPYTVSVQGGLKQDHIVQKMTFSEPEGVLTWQEAGYRGEAEGHCIKVAEDDSTSSPAIKTAAVESLPVHLPNLR